ncbi:MAG: type II toxin-antitoxin system VapC family toxin [Myxococcota bacterium]
MTVLDTSAVIAILFGEPEAELFAEAIESDHTRLISAASVLEASIVAESELGEALLFKGNDFSQTDVRIFTNVGEAS